MVGKLGIYGPKHYKTTTVYAVCWTALNSLNSLNSLFAQVFLSYFSYTTHLSMHN